MKDLIRKLQWCIANIKAPAYQMAELAEALSIAQRLYNPAEIDGVKYDE